MAILHRLHRENAQPIAFVLDGKPCEGRAGDSVLVAILAQRERLRTSDWAEEARAGFCQMGACQDCWIYREDGTRLRACTSALEEGMRLLTGAAP